MNIHEAKSQKGKSNSVANTVSRQDNHSASSFPFIDNRREAITQRKLQALVSANVKQQPETSKETSNKGSYSLESRMIVQKTPLGMSQARKGHIYLWQNGLVRVTATKVGKGGVLMADVVWVWPVNKRGTSDTIPSANMDDGEGSDRFQTLTLAMKAHDQKALEEKKTKQKETEILKSKPTVQWGKESDRSLREIAGMISEYISSTVESPEGGAKKGVNSLGKVEFSCVSDYGTKVKLEDPYIGIKHLENGTYAVMSNMGGIKVYDNNGKYLTDGNGIKGGGRSVHCEAALNDIYDQQGTNHKPAKAVKVEAGHAVSGAQSQNCLLCSLDARRRGYPYDPHSNPPNHWNYKVMPHEQPLFPGALKKPIRDLIQMIINSSWNLGMDELITCKYDDDQEIVDTLSTILDISNKASEGLYIDLDDNRTSRRYAEYYGAAAAMPQDWEPYNEEDTVDYAYRDLLRNKLRSDKAKKETKTV